jgi:hypothetical protein
MNQSSAIFFDRDTLHKELDLVQIVINRLANNSFLLKGWLIAIVSIILSVSKESVFKPESIYLYAILCLPFLSIWYLDAYFLRQERLYRKLYEWIILERPTGNTEHLYALDPQRRFEVSSIFRVMLSETLRMFYGIPLVILLILIIKIISNN